MLRYGVAVLLVEYCWRVRQCWGCVFYVSVKTVAVKREPDFE